MTTDDLFPAKASGKAANGPEVLLPNPKGKLREPFHEVARFKHLALRTEGGYWAWVMQYLKFHRSKSGGWRQPKDLGTTGVNPKIAQPFMAG